jgi:hypothetical protein
MPQVEPLGVIGIEGVHYYVHDLERSRRFYVDGMDFSEIGESSPELTAAGSPALERWRRRNSSSGGRTTCGRGATRCAVWKEKVLPIRLGGRSSGNCSGAVSSYTQKMGFTVGGSCAETRLIFWVSAVWDLEVGVEAQKKSPSVVSHACLVSSIGISKL